ncbi:unnamed protein product [Pylaiella littoralis]
MVWYLLVADLAVLTTTTVFSFISASHIVLTWCMRKNFHVAVRSPGLATMIGCASTTMCTVAVFRDLLGFWPGTGVWDLFGTVVLLTLYTAAYVFRSIRLLVMYNPRARKRWGRFIKEPLMMTILLVSCGVLLGVEVSACYQHGVETVAQFVFLTYILDNIVTLVACLVLVRKLRDTDDMFHLSQEMQKVGAFAMLALVMTPVYIAFQWRYMMFAWMMARFQFALWFTNIQPVRAALKRRAANKDGTGGFVTLLFPWRLWTRLPSSKVAIDRQNIITFHSESPRSGGANGVLDSIIHSPPLYEAFEGYCRKALCCEMLMFLRDVEDFSASLHAAATTSAARHARRSRQFAECIVIINKYIKDGSPFEINIKGTTRTEILMMADRVKFNKLPLRAKDTIFHRAAKEVSAVLENNVYSGFMATEEYKHIQDQRFDVVEQVEDG